MTTTEKNRPRKSPWGRVQHWTNIASGIAFASCAGHGGFKLSRARNARVPAAVRRPGGWYEEDCEWALVALVFPEAFSADSRTQAVYTAKDYFPDEYTALTGEPVTPEESYELRRRAAAAREADLLAAGRAVRSSAVNIGEGRVHVLFRRADRSSEGRYMSAETYRAVSFDGPATPEDYAAHGTVEPAPADFVW